MSTATIKPLDKFFLTEFQSVCQDIFGLIDTQGAKLVS